MLQKLSLILLCGLVTVPVTPLHADTCKRLFEIEEIKADQNSQLGNLETYKIISPQIGVFEINRSQKEFATLYAEGYTLLRVLIKDTKILGAEHRSILQEYSPGQSYQGSQRNANNVLTREYAANILEIQSELVRAREEKSTLTAAKNRSQDQIDAIDREIEEVRQRITKAENLAYKLEIITAEVNKLIAEKKVSPDKLRFHGELFRSALSEIRTLKFHLGNIEGLKKDLLSVIETQALPQTSKTRRFYDFTNNSADVESTVMGDTTSLPNQRSTRLFLNGENHNSARPIPLPAQPKPTGTVRGLGRTVLEPPSYVTMIGSKTGPGTSRPTSTTLPDNSGRGITRTTYVPPSGVTGKVDLSPTSRNMTLNLEYAPASKSFPAEKILEELRAWVRNNNIHTLVTFTHSGKKEDPILVSFKFKDEKMAEFYLQKLKEDFSTRNPQLRDAHISSAASTPAPYSRKITLSFRQNSPVKMLEDLRAWSQRNGLYSQITFGHSGRIEDPITVTFKTKDQNTAEVLLKKIRDDFRTYNPELRE